MNQELRIYAVDEGRMEDWIGLFQNHIMPFHEARGYHVRMGWVDAAKNQFLWVRDVGDEAVMNLFREELRKEAFMAKLPEFGVKVLEVRVLQPAIGP